MNGMDMEYVWCSRINSVFKYKRRRVSLPDAAAIGLDFNVAYERKTKLDLSVLTNGAVLDIYEFAKISEASVRYLMSDILEYNYDTGIENDEQRHAFANHVFQKFTLLKKSDRTGHRDRAFLLPNRETLRLSDVSEACHPSTHLSESSDKSTLVAIERIHEPDATTESFQVDPDGETNLVDEAKECTGVKGLYPRCDAMGLELYIRPNNAQKQKLDPRFLTNKVVLEVLRYARIVAGTKGKTAIDVLNHNFDLSGYENGMLQKILKLKYRGRDCINPEDKLAFRAAPCIFVHDSQKRKWRKNLAKDSQPIALPSKRSKREPKPVYDGGFCDSRHLPCDELKNFGTNDAELDSEQKTQTVEQSDTTFKPPPGHQKHTPAVECRSDKEAPPGRPYKDGGSGAEEHKLRLWKRRAMRSWDVLAMCFKGKPLHLDFDIGAGAKFKANLRFLTHGMLQDLFQFANRMSRTETKFTKEIFLNNFSLDRKALPFNFLKYISLKMKKLVSNDLRRSSDFLNAIVDFPDHYNMGVKFSPATEVGTQPSETLLNPGMAKYPFCAALGVNFWAVRQRPPSEKLEVGLLTNGALLEVSSFIRELCGNVCQLMYDVLDHNYHLGPKAFELGPALKEWSRLQKESKGGTSEQDICFDRIVEAIPNCTKEYRPDPKRRSGSKRRPSDQAVNKLSVCAPKQGKLVHVNNYPLCKELLLHLDMSSKRKARAKLDLHVLTRAVVYEIHRYVLEAPQVEHYIPALFRILENNFDLTSQLHRRSEFALAIASQVRTMTGNFRGSSTRKEGYLSKVFELPFEFQSSGQGACKAEREDAHCELDVDGDDDDDDIKFVCKLVPVDIEVQLV